MLFFEAKYTTHLRNIYKCNPYQFNMAFGKLKRVLFGSKEGEYPKEDYLEIDVGVKEKKDNKVLVKLFTLKQYDEVNDILNALREGYTIAVIDIRLLKKKDSIELKRAVSKIKKTAEALEGTIAGFGESIVIVTPSFAKVHKDPTPVKQEKKSEF